MYSTKNLTLIGGIEVMSMIITRVIVHYYPWNSVQAEVMRTGLRLGVAYLCWRLLKPLICSRRPIPGFAQQPALFLAILGFFAVPVLTGHMGLKEELVLLFAVTSIAVALKEEFLFRGIIQNVLQTRFGFPTSVLLTSVVFTLWHIGLVPANAWQFTEIFFAGIFLGVIYVRTGSMFLVIALHGTYDALYSLSPLLVQPYSVVIGFLLLVFAVSLGCIKKDFLKAL